MEKRMISTAKAPAAIGAYSQGVSLNDLVFTSGQLPYTFDGIIEDDIQAQTRQSLLNLQAVLEAAGSSLAKVIKTTVFIKNMNDFPKINEVYASFFEKPFPARSCIEAARLPKDVQVEIEAIAFK